MSRHENLKFEDTIQCNFFSSIPFSQNDWEQVCNSINKTIISKSQGYLWNRDDFQVTLPLQSEKNKDMLQHCSSVTCFGENIEDEWFIVFLIYELSKEYDFLIVQVEDCDGAFLLIEAADYLPTWLHPDNADNRVFIYQNNIHIITPELVALNSTLDVSYAIKLIANNSDKTIASLEIQEALNKRISVYPQKIHDCTHNAIVRIPVDLAAILKLKPSLIAAIANSYCSHDFVDKESIKKVNYTNCVNTKIQFTKYLYALLMHTKLVKGIKHSYISEKDKKAQLGFKLTCGFNLIMNRNNTAIFDSQEYKKYISRLKKAGYFKNNIEGSKEYQNLIEKAKSHYLSTECSFNTHIYHEICSLMSDRSFVEIKESLTNRENAELSEDDDDWLNINSEQLNEMLNSTYGGQFKLKDEDLGSSQKITSALTDFLEKNSDFEGIEIDKEDRIEEKIYFDADQFSSCLENMLKIVTNGHNETESDDSESLDDTFIDNQDIDEELMSKLCNMPNIADNNTIINNFMQSMKEEGLSGPSSNVFKSIGINKVDLLDSDDDCD